MYKRLKVVDDRAGGGKLVRIGVRARRAYGADNRPILNVDGTYPVILTNGTKANVAIRAVRGGEPTVNIPFHGVNVAVPITSVARSIKTDERGNPIRA